MSEQYSHRTLILDTSVLVHDPHCMEAFPHDTIIISSWVIDQLDSLKRNLGEQGEHARRASRMIHEYSTYKGFPEHVILKSGGTLKVYGEEAIPLDSGPSAHNKTIALAKQLKSRIQEIAVVSKDPHLHIKTRMQRVQSINYQGDGRAHDPYDLFPGYIHIPLESRELIDELYRNQWISADKVPYKEDLIPNQCAYFTFEGKDTLAIYKKNKKIFCLVPKPKTNGEVDKSKGVQPNNCEQAFAYFLLTDPSISLVALVGSAGPGKTLMSLLGGYHQLKNEYERIQKNSSVLKIPMYNKLIVFRPTVEMGRPLGFLPGPLEEKIEPWMEPIFDNMELILEHTGTDLKNSKHYDPVMDLLDRNLLQILPINHIRGRSIHHAFIIIDEAQNLTSGQLKSLVTRAGKGTKVILTGDITQIDDPYMDERSNGLSCVISNFIGQELFGYTIMKRGEERSLLAKLASQLL